MKLNYKIILIGFIIAALSSFFINFLGFVIGGLVVGYLIRDDYNNAAINGAIAGLSTGVLLDIILLIPWFYSLVYGNVFANLLAFIILIGNLVAGLGLGGIGGFCGIFIREQIEKPNY